MIWVWFMELDRDKIIYLFHQLDNVIASLIREENLTSDTKYKFFIFGGSALLLSTNYPTRRTQDIDAGYNYDMKMI